MMRQFMPNLVMRYIIRHFLSKFLMLTLGLLSLIYVITFVEMIRKLSDNDQETFVQMLYLTFAQLAPVIDKVFPFFILLSSLWSIFSLLKTSELTILKVSSVSVWRIGATYCLIAFSISLIYICAIMPLLTHMYQEFRAWEDSRGFKNYPVYKKIILSDNQSAFLKAAAFNPQSNNLQDITIIYLEENGLVKQIYYVKSGIYDPETRDIHFDNLAELKANLSKIPPIKNIDNYIINVNLNDITKETKRKNALYNIYEYSSLIRIKQAQNLSTQQLKTIFYSLLMMPITCALYCLIGLISVPALYRGIKGSKNILIALAGGILFYILDGGFIVLAGNESLPLILALWVPKIIILLICMIIIFNKEYSFVRRKPAA